MNWKSVAGSNLDAGLFVTNVANKKYFSTVSGACAALGFELAQVAPPQMFGLRLRYSFE